MTQMMTSPEINSAKPALACSPKLWTVGTLTYTSAGLAVLFCWLLWGDFAWSMRERSVAPVMQLLFKKYGASDMLAGFFLSALPAALGMLISPVVSYNSDRHRGRWGRRIPYLLIPTPIVFLAMAGLAFSPQIGAFCNRAFGLRSVGENLSVLISLGLFWTLFEMACMVANTVFGALVNDVVPAAIIGRFYGLFRMLSLIAGIVFNYWIFGYSENHSLWIFLGIGILYGLGFTLTCLNVREGEYPPVVEAEGESAFGLLGKIKTYFREGFGSSYYLCFFSASTLICLTSLPVNLYSIYYAQSIGMSMKTYGACLAATYVVSLVLAYPLGALADRFHPLRVSIGGIFAYGVAVLFGGLFVHSAWGFGLFLILHGVFSGIYVTSSASLGQRLLPRERFAELGSAGGIIGSLSFIIISPVIGKTLDFSKHNYRLTFFMGAAIALLATVNLLMLHRRFMALGGVKNYVAPDTCTK